MLSFWRKIKWNTIWSKISKISSVLHCGSRQLVTRLSRDQFLRYRCRPLHSWSWLRFHSAGVIMLGLQRTLAQCHSTGTVSSFHAHLNIEVLVSSVSERGWKPLTDSISLECQDEQKQDISLLHEGRSPVPLSPFMRLPFEKTGST